MIKNEIAEELLETKRRLVSGEFSADLMSALKYLFPDSSDNFFVIGWITEQLEDIYTVMVQGRWISEIEIPKNGTDIGQYTCSIYTVPDYLKKNPQLSKRTKRKIREGAKLAG